MFWSDKKSIKNSKHSVAVIGLSSFGYYLCRYLSDIGADVLAIDIKEDKIDSVKTFVKQAIVADGRNKETLQNLGLNEFDEVIVSVGEEIDASILITLHLRELGAKEILAKAITEDHARILNIIGASEIIFPERDMAKRVAHTLHHPSIIDYFYIGDEYSLVEMAPPKAWIGKSLIELDIRRNHHVQVIMVKEVVPENVTLIPGGDHVVKDSDILVVIGREEDMNKIESY